MIAGHQLKSIPIDILDIEHVFGYCPIAQENATYLIRPGFVSQPRDTVTETS
jgi:hypothetical protein